MLKRLMLFSIFEVGGWPEHFQALETFWNDVVKNPQVAQGSI
jgi:hypothetical protein